MKTLSVEDAIILQNASILAVHVEHNMGGTAIAEQRGARMIDKILERLTAKKNEWLDTWRDASIVDDTEDCFYADGMSEAFLEAISIVQEVAKEYGKDTNVRSNGWIPCSERLPNWNEYEKNDGRFIVTDGNRVYQSIFDIYFANGCFKTLKLFHFVGGTQSASFEVDKCVIAWMELPAPCQKGE